MSKALSHPHHSEQTVRKLGEKSDPWCIKIDDDAPVFIEAKFLNGVKSNMKTMPMLKTWTPPPDIYNMNACIGKDFAGEIARSQARFSFKDAYDSDAAATDFDWDFEA